MHAFAKGPAPDQHILSHPQAVAGKGSMASTQDSPPPLLRPRRTGHHLGALLCLSLALCWSLPVIAQTASGDKSGTTAKKVVKKDVKKSAKKSGKPASVNKKADSSPRSQETTKERERRLLRECKGRPNAGACEGFAS
jgi:hypothetical protein